LSRGSNPQTLQTVWFNQLINTVETDEWNYPGVLSALHDGFLYLIYGYRLAKLDPKDGKVLGQVKLPTGRAAPRDTSYNGLSGLPDGTLVAKSVYRERGCEQQGFSAFLCCPHPQLVPNSVVVAIDPRTLEVIDQTVAPELIGGRITATEFENHSYVYLTGQKTVFRYIYEDRRLTLDRSWNPGTVILSGQSGPSAAAVMNDWVVFATNSVPASTSLSVVAINQADASRQFSSQPFAAGGSPQSWCVSAVLLILCATGSSSWMVSLAGSPPWKCAMMACIRFGQLRRSPPSSSHSLDQRSVASLSARITPAN